MKILVTGAAGFIGMHVCNALLKNGKKVVGIDNINDYYSVRLKKHRLKILKDFKNFKFIKADIKNKNKLKKIFSKEKFTHVINLAAQAGVAYSLINPHSYIDSNIIGFLNILENCKNNKIKHLIYASSSSIYGLNKQAPFSENHNVSHPISLYAASKRSNELMAHTYSHLYNLPTTGLRFFTVYGEWGRPDMAIYIFTKSILENKSININNYGNMYRDFTYISDIVSPIIKLLNQTPQKNLKLKNLKTFESTAPFRLFNIGNNNPVKLSKMVNIIENILNKKAIKNLRGMQKGDVPMTKADTRRLKKITGFKPNTPITVGIKRFIKWYKEFNKK